MKSNLKNLTAIALIVVFSASQGWAQGKKSRKASAPAKRAKNIDMSQQFDNLGNNEEIILKAQALQPNNNMRIVQKREVDREWRTELGGSYGYVNGGDSYIQTANFGANLDLHINPHWSIGARYVENRNELTNEGKQLFDEAAAKVATGDPNYRVPDVDFPVRTYMAVINWYPIYGKVSWLESSVTQFDFYLLAGGGQIELTNSKSAIYTAGAGMGMWWNSWLTSRLELRYQNYRDKVYSGDRNINAFVAQVGVGFLLW